MDVPPLYASDSMDMDRQVSWALGLEYIRLHKAYAPKKVLFVSVLKIYDIRWKVRFNEHFYMNVSRFPS